MRITRVFFDGDCYLKIRAEMEKVDGKKLILWVPEYLDHLFRTYADGARYLPLSFETEDGEAHRADKAKISFHGQETVNGEYQLEITYESLTPMKLES